MNPDEALKIIRSVEWPHEASIYTVDAVIKGEVAGFVNARSLDRHDLQAWMPAGVQVFDPVIIYKSGRVSSSVGAAVPFERIERIEIQ